jgi:glycosyltransferase involved in cell wall biosynthesis
MEEAALDFELILVDDGSTDATFATAAALARADRRLRVIKFRRNYGQTAAMSAGIQAARNPITVTLDGDLQNDPGDIHQMVRLLDKGHDIVIGWRQKRQDNGPRVVISRIANRIIARTMGVAVKDSGCSLKAFRTELIQAIPIYGEMHRFIPALSRLAGARLIEIPVRHHPRQFGKSKYGFGRIYRVMLDIVTIRTILSYSRRPFAWHAMLTLPALLLSIVFFVTSFRSTNVALLDITASLLCLSLAMFLTAWGIIGQLMASIEPSIVSFASLCARIASLPPGGRP